MANKSKNDKIMKIVHGTILVVLFLAILLFSKYASSASVYLQANPSSGQSPLSTTLSWTSTQVDSCLLESVPVPVNGSTTRIVNQDTTYGIACTGGKNFATVTWQAPTKYTDGTDIVSSGSRALGGFEIYYSTNPNQVDAAMPIVINDPSARSYVINGLPNSVYYYKMKAYLVDGTRSDFTQPVSNTINYVQVQDTVFVDITPLPPVGFVTVETGVFNVVKKEDGFVLVQVGTVPLGTPCNRTETVNGKYVVPRASVVTWLGTVKPSVVVATCEDR